MGILKANQKRILKEAGFLPGEIKEYDAAVDPLGNPQPNIFDTKPFQYMILSRKEYIKRLQSYGWNNREIIRRLLVHRRARGSSVWDFLKIEYRPPRSLTDDEYNEYDDARRRLSRTLGKGYGKVYPPQKRPIGKPQYPEKPRKI